MKQSEIAKSLNTLAEEFAREVLNVQAEAQMPIMPSPFAAFLGEENKKCTIEGLEKQRKKIRLHIKMMQEELKVIEKEIAATKTKKENT